VGVLLLSSLQPVAEMPPNPTKLPRTMSCQLPPVLSIASLHPARVDSDEKVTRGNRPQNVNYSRARSPGVEALSLAARRVVVPPTHANGRDERFGPRPARHS